jgi:hypothetical protein
MTNFDYQTPIITALRDGSTTDPYVDKNDTLQIDVNSKVILTEIPVKFNRVVVTGQSVTWVEIQSGTPTENQYIVDYVNKIVTFHESRQGLQLSFTYKGRGLIYVPTSMIYISQSNGEVTQVLSDITDKADNFKYIDTYNSSTIYKKFNIVRYQESTYMYISSTSTSGNLPTDTSFWIKIAGFSNRGVYSTSTTYSAGDVIRDSLDENIYQSLVDGNLNQILTDTSKWQLLVSVSAAVANANALVHRGDYSSIVSYVKNNIVYYQGSTYICISNSIGNLPTDINSTNWKRISVNNWKGTYSTATTYQFGDSVVDNINQNVYASIADGNINQTLTDTSKWQLLLSVSQVIAVANNITNSSIKIYKPYVSTYTDIVTTYPTPAIGWTVEATDTKIVYRWDGTVWIPIEKKDTSLNVVIGNVQPNDFTVLWIETNQTNTLTNVYSSTTAPTNTSLVWLDTN